MKQTKDLSWLSAPAFLIILAIIGFNTFKPAVPLKQVRPNTANAVVSVNARPE